MRKGLISADQLSEALVEDWFAGRANAFVVNEPAPHADLIAFGLGEAPVRVHALLDGRTRLSELAARVRSPEARLNLMRLTYLLVQTDHARLS